MIFTGDKLYVSEVLGHALTTSSRCKTDIWKPALTATTATLSWYSFEKRRISLLTGRFLQTDSHLLYDYYIKNCLMFIHCFQINKSVFVAFLVKFRLGKEGIY